LRQAYLLIKYKDWLGKAATNIICWHCRRAYCVSHEWMCGLAYNGNTYSDWNLRLCVFEL